MLWFVLVIHNIAGAQNINVDYHDGRGIPEISFSAAGLPGQWNALLSSDTASGVPRSLFDVDGQSIAATLTHSNLNFFVTPVDITGTSGQKALVGDYAGSTGPPLQLDFNGLANGLYSVFTYMVGRQDAVSSFGQSATLNDDPSTLRSATGLWSGAFTMGQTHTYHEVNVNNGSLRITISGFGDPIVNGVQLTYLQAPEPNWVALLIPSLVAGASWRRRLEMR